MKHFSLTLSLLSLSLFSLESLAQSTSKEATNLFAEKNKEKSEEIVDGIKDTLSETDNAIEKTVSDLEKSINADETNIKEDNMPQKAQENVEINQDPMENTLVLKLKTGDVVIKLLPEVAPNHVARIKQLTREGFYDNVVFHRVIDGFMAQTGDPTGTGRGGSGKKLEAEFSNVKHIRGTVSMARAADPNSADSQFFITFEESPHLNGNYTVFGEVTSGMEHVDSIKKGYGPNGMVSEPDSIVSLKVATDIDPEKLPAALKENGESEDKDSNADSEDSGDNKDKDISETSSENDENKN